MRRVLIFISLIASLHFVNAQSQSEADGTKVINYQSKTNKLNIFKISYWSSYGLSGSVAFFNMVGQSASAISISEDMIDIAEDIETKFHSSMFELEQFAKSYPSIIFGINSIIGGTAFIPICGSLIFASFEYTVGISLSILNSVSPLKMFYLSNYPGDVGDSYYLKLRELHTKMFDPTSYYVVGTIGVITGIVEIVLYYYYNREVLRNKYPHFQKVITMIPGGISIGLDI